MKKYTLTHGSKEVFYSLEELQKFHQKAVDGFAIMERLWDEYAEAAKNAPIDSQGRATITGLNLYQWLSKHARSMGEAEINCGPTQIHAQPGYAWGPKSIPQLSVQQTALSSAERQRDDGKKEVARLLQKNAEFLRRIEKGRLRPQDGLWYVEMRGGHRYLCSVYLNMKATCEKCDLQVNPEQLTYHKKTVRCKEGATMKEIRERGMLHCRDQRIIKAVRSGIIVGELVPTKYDIYVPQWVMEATTAFDQQGGYAGIDFQDYLAKLAPEKENV